MSEKSSKGSTTTLSSIKRSSDSSKNDQPPVKKKINLSFGQKIALKKKDGNPPAAVNSSPLSIKLASKQAKASSEIKLVPKSKKTAAIFNESSDSEPEEMPVEARMRMKNIGRNTPTSAGPNSFNKGKMGFVDNQKSWELQQQDLLTKLSSKKGSK